MADTPNQAPTPEERAKNPVATPQPTKGPDDHLANADPIAPADQYESPFEQPFLQTDAHRDLAPEEDSEYFNEYRTEGETLDLPGMHGGRMVSAPSTPKKVSTTGESYQPLPWWAIGAGVLLLWGGYYMGAYNGGLQGDVFSDVANYKPVQNGPPEDPNSQPAMIKAGQKIFTVNCALCHQSTGLGVAGQFPPLVGSEWVLGDAPKRLQQILLHGIQGTIHVKGNEYNNAMPAWNVTLNDKQIAQVLTYVRGQLGGNNAPMITEAQMDEARKLTPDRTDPWSEAELKAIPAGPIDAGGAGTSAAAAQAPANNNPPNSTEGAAKPTSTLPGQGPSTPAASPAP